MLQVQEGELEAGWGRGGWNQPSVVGPDPGMSKTAWANT